MPFISEGSERQWKPSKKQEEFLRIPFTVFEAFYGGAAGGGKSEILIIEPIVYNFHQNPNFKGIIFRRTFPQLEESLIPRSREYYAPCGASYNEQKHLWTFPSGATIRFGYMDRDSSARDHDTAEYNYVAFDELTHFTEFMYLYLLSRVRTSDPSLPAFARAASNPGNIGHSWVRKRFVDPTPKGGKLIYDAKSQSYRIFIQALASDNPYLQSADPGYIHRLQMLPSEAERKAKIEGDWYAFAGQVFTEFRSEKLPGEPDNALHVIEPFDIPSWWPKVMAADWGYTAQTWVGWCAISPDSRKYLYREYVCQKRSIKEWTADVARLSQFDENIVYRVLDPSAWRNDGSELTIAEQVFYGTGKPWEKADNDRLGGKQLIHDMLRWSQKPKSFVPAEGYLFDTEQRIFRMRGQIAALEYRKMFEPEPTELNIPQLLIFKNCTAVVEALQMAVYPEDAKGKRVEDVAEFTGDDPYDGLRYLLKAVDRYIDLATEESKKRERLNIILQKVKETGDMTAFHRQMELLEIEEGKVLPFVARSGRMARRVG